jgi:hypothetical protein
MAPGPFQAIQTDPDRRGCEEDVQRNQELPRQAPH